MRTRTLLLTLVLVLLLLLLPARLYADAIPLTISFAVPTPLTLTPQTFTVLSSDALNGTELSGQTLVLDLLLGGDVVARVNADMLAILFRVQTTASTIPFTYPGEPTHAPTGIVFDSTLGSLGSFEIGAWTADDGSLGVGMPFITHTGVYEAKGARMELTLPSTGWSVTGVDMIWAVRGKDSSVVFGTPTQLPEWWSGGYIVIGLVVLAGLVWARQ